MNAIAPLSQSHLPITERHYPDITGLILAFDFGEKRIGVAIGETLLKKARALTVIEGEMNNARFTQIAALVDTWQPSLLLVGLPMHLDGNPHQLTALCKKFAQRLEGRFNLPVMMMDERLSSAEAKTLMQDAGISVKRQQKQLDAVAAQVILQSYFDQSTHLLNHAAT